MKSRILLFLIVTFSVVAAGTCYLLLLKHLTGTSGQTWFEAGCSDRVAPNVSCATVLQSPYSYFPPKYPDEPTTPRRWHLPAALIGLMYYTTLAVWFIGVGAPARSRAGLHALATLGVGLGLAGSAYYSWIMFAKLNAWCPYCLLTHVLNFLIAICVVLLWPMVMQKPAVTAPAETDVPAATPPTPRAHVPVSWPQPLARTFFVTVLAILTANLALLSLVGLRSYRLETEAQKGNFNTCLSQLNVFRSDPVLLLTQWQRTAAQPVSVGPSEPVRIYTGDDTPDPSWPNVVVFSDFECPSCNRFARFFEAQIVPIFERRIATTFKHYPIDRACNPRAGQTLHPHACEAAKMAEGARVIAGNEGFWRAHDFLFNQRDELAAGGITVDRFARELNLDPARVREAMASDQVKARIAEDIRQAGELGVSGTPAIFVNGKAVAQISKMEPAFWRALAEALAKGEAGAAPRPPAETAGSK